MCDSLLDYKEQVRNTLVCVRFNSSVHTSKRTPHFTITKISWLMLFEEVMTVYSEKHKKPINTKCRITDY
jgi:hypothetical protein